MVIGKSLPNTLAGISLPKAKISNTCMKMESLLFDPPNDDIEEYIRDVKESSQTARPCDDAVVNLLKATIPTELYGTLYGP